MDRGKKYKTQKHFKHDCKMEGAIMMSNRATKQECLAKKLFALPPNMINFTERVKAGMLLFLFEYEERKLYGVFEATTDGAVNIVPDAFQSSGKSFPAQVLFKRVWMCRPLSEDEFSHAIIDNYYAPKKFHFNLSYDQVFKLVQLFSLRRINIIEDLHHVPHEIISMFQNGYSGNGRRSRHLEVKSRKSHLIDPEPYSMKEASSLDISPLPEDLVSVVDSSNAAANVSFERYDPTNSADTYIERSNSEKEITSSPSDEGYPSNIRPKLRADTEVKRTSVFSRLSAADSNAATKRRSFSGIDELKMEESSKRPKKLECISNMRSDDQSATDVGAFERNDTAEATPNLKWIAETEMYALREIGAVDRGTLYGHKEMDDNSSTPVFGEDCTDEARPNLKMELVGMEDTSKPVDGTEDAQAGTEVVASDDLEKISLCLEDTLPFECRVGEASSGDIEKGFGGRKKEVKSRNLLWFLEKTSKVETNILDAAACKEQTECN